MPSWTDGYVDVNGIKIHYYRTGGDKPKVIFNHGAGDDGTCWTHVAKELENDYDVIMVDARGHGKSSSGNGNYTTAARVEDLSRVVKALGLDRPVIGGHSLGGDTSMNFAATHPELTRGIFLEDPPIMLPGETWVLPEGKMKDMNLEKIGKMMKNFMLVFKILPGFIALPLAKKMNPSYPQDEILPWLSSKKRLSFNFLNSMADMSMMEAKDPTALFKKINVPVLLIIGDKKKMSIVSKEAAAKVSEVNSGVKVIQLEGADHNIRRTRFDGYLPALKEFLSSIYQ